MVFEVGRQFAQQPDDLDVALAFGLQQAGRTEAMQITVEVKFEQHRRVIRRAARLRTPGLGEAQRVQIQRSDKGVEETDRVFDGNVILQPFGKEQRLGPVQTTTMIHA